MSYKNSPQVLRAGTPGPTNDAANGFILGAVWIDSSVSPRVAYTCVDSTTGAAVWRQQGGTGGSTDHPSLTTLGWSSSGHTGTTNSVACFDNTGGSQTVQATVEGTVLSFTGGTLQFIAMAATMALVNQRTLEYEQAPVGATLIPYEDARVVSGSIV